MSVSARRVREEKVPHRDPIRHRFANGGASFPTTARPRFRFRLHPIVVVNQRVKGKRCRDCKQFLYPTSRWFHRDKNRPDGFQLYCKTCKGKRDHRSYEKNREKRLRSFKQWKIDHREHVNARHRTYIKEYRSGKRRSVAQPVPEQARPTDVRLCSTCGGAFRESQFPMRGAECRSCRNKRQPKYRDLHKRAVYRQNRRARAVGRIGSEDWQAILAKYGSRCAYCGASGKLTMDHVVPLARGGRHDPSNIVPACGSCNSRKHTKLWSPGEAPDEVTTKG
jgi:5-methylcytosine-specific restriction endonuclease McrA